MVHGFAMLRSAGKKIFEIMYWFSVMPAEWMQRKFLILPI